MIPDKPNGEIESCLTVRKALPLDEILRQLGLVSRIWKNMFPDWRLVEA